MPTRQTQLAKGRSIGRKLVCYDGRWRNTVLPEQFTHQFESCRLVAPGLDQKIQHLALSIDRAPEIHLPSANRYKHLVQVPTVIRSWPEASEFPGIAVSELENPTTHGLVRHVEAALGQQILDVSEAQREAAIKPYGIVDDLRRESVAAIGDRFYRRRVDYCHSTRKPINVTAPLSLSADRRPSAPGPARRRRRGMGRRAGCQREGRSGHAQSGA